MADPDFVYAWPAAGGSMQRIPTHWLSDPVIGLKWTQIPPEGEPPLPAKVDVITRDELNDALTTPEVMAAVLAGLAPELDDTMADLVDLEGGAFAAKQKASLASSRPEDVSASTVGAVVVAEPPAAAFTITTYDGSNQITHPSVYFNPRGWNGRRYWMAATPYNGSDVTIENPCIYVSDDGITWAAPAGLTNPIEPHPGGSNYNSDTHLVLGPDGRLYCFWRYTGGGVDAIRFRSSADGVTWSAMQTAVSYDITVRRLLSPAITWDDGTWHMWAVDLVPSPNKIVHLTAAAPAGPWSAGVECTGFTFPANREAWHLDCRRVGSEFVMIVNDSLLNNSGTGGSLYRAVSRDGVTFTQDADPFMVPIAGTWAAALYRSCIVPARVRGRDGYEVFVASAAPAWKIGRAVALLTDRPARQDDAANLTAAVGGFSGYVVGDVFNRADSAVTPGTTSSGAPWTVDAGTLGVASKQLYAPAAANSRATVQANLADVEVGATFKTVGPTGAQSWLVARFTDSTNYIRAGVDGTGVYAIQKIVAGAATTLASISASYLPPTSGQRVRLVCKGTTLTLYVNDRPVCAATGVTDHQTATKAGIQTQANTPRFADFYAKAA